MTFARTAIHFVAEEDVFVEKRTAETRASVVSGLFMLPSSLRLMLVGRLEHGYIILVVL